jgi:hypothetical protein
MQLSKCFEILVGSHGGGARIAVIARNLGCDPLPIGIGAGIGWPLGGPSVAQGPPKRHARAIPRVDLRKSLCLQQKLKKAGWGGEEIAKIAGIAKNW